MSSLYRRDVLDLTVCYLHIVYYTVLEVLYPAAVAQSALCWETAAVQDLFIANIFTYWPALHKSVTHSFSFRCLHAYSCSVPIYSSFLPFVALAAKKISSSALL